MRRQLALNFPWRRLNAGPPSGGAPHPNKTAVQVVQRGVRGCNTIKRTGYEVSMKVVRALLRVPCPSDAQPPRPEKMDASTDGGGWTCRSKWTSHRTLRRGKILVIISDQRSGKNRHRTRFDRTKAPPTSTIIRRSALPPEMVSSCHEPSGRARLLRCHVTNQKLSCYLRAKRMRLASCPARFLPRGEKTQSRTWQRRDGGQKASCLSGAARDKCAACRLAR